MAGTFKPWLQSLIEAEIQAVVAWKSRFQPGVKADPEDARFHDDGSNFRSDVPSSALDGSSKVQLLKVYSCKDDVSVLLSDGHVQIKASLSSSAIRAFEEQLDDEQLNLDLRGDIFLIEDVAVKSTPWGPEDGFVQLEVHGLEYVKMMRKIIGPTKPIEDTEAIVALIEQIRRIRATLYELETGPSGNNTASKSPVRNAPNDFGASQTKSPGSPISQTFPSSPPALPSDSEVIHFNSQLSQGNLVTQPRRRETPSKRGGLQIGAGVNLSHPQPPILLQPQLRGSPSQGPSRRKETNDKLLSLLNGGRQVPFTDAQTLPYTKDGDGNLVAETPPKTRLLDTVGSGCESSARIPRKRRSRSGFGSEDANPFEHEGHKTIRSGEAYDQSPTAQQIPESRTQNSDGISQEHQAASTADKELLCDAQMKSDDISRRVEESGDFNSLEAANGITSAQRPLQSTDNVQIAAIQIAATKPQQVHKGIILSSASGKSVEIRQHRIPPDQLRLLEKKTSWFPALPGETLPHPNVPIELLKVWNHKQTMLNSTPSPASVRSPVAELELPSSQPSQSKNPVETRARSESSEELGPSQWPPTSSPRSSPIRRNQELPPDSSASQMQDDPMVVPTHATLSLSQGEAGLSKPDLARAQRGLPANTPTDPRWSRESQYLRGSQRDIDELPMAVPRALSIQSLAQETSTVKAKPQIGYASNIPDWTVLDSPDSERHGRRGFSSNVLGRPLQPSQPTRWGNENRGPPRHHEYRQPSRDRYRYPSRDRLRHPSLSNHGRPSGEDYVHQSSGGDRDSARNDHRRTSGENYRPPSNDGYRNAARNDRKRLSRDDLNGSARVENRGISRGDRDEVGRYNDRAPSRDMFSTRDHSDHRRPSFESSSEPTPSGTTSYRQRRRNFIQDDIRGRWLESRYGTDIRKPFNLSAAVKAYHKDHPEDITGEELQRAYSRASEVPPNKASAPPKSNKRSRSHSSRRLRLASSSSAGRSRVLINPFKGTAKSVSPQRNEQVMESVEVNEQQPLTAIQEFSQAWLRLAPGGFFAQASGMERDAGPMHMHGQMNVLDWDTWW